MIRRGRYGRCSLDLTSITESNPAIVRYAPSICVTADKISITVAVKEGTLNLTINLEFIEIMNEVGR